ncbi:MAG: class I SAM-dependent methyltransferase [Luteibacter sp.]|uniref:class I SAM-dependent methyltransferase n=1 Tax=Luteibacter sp. TaxID=1886636 RepID=UPI00280858F9|nr:class I SAM-dependent methyltransferase [Luteibacter sp.]MDQ7997134.1 class I SAM-dependent methyltransferase [Luteibacter sp.]MDQ8049784.1 class I SAM-dependent methyltransferase [Luteibacter sp.]
MNEASREAASEGKGKWDVVTRYIGAIDLHYHFRTKPLVRFFERDDQNADVRVFEFGCGIGDNLIELRSRRPAMVGLGVDIDQAFIDQAQRSGLREGFSDLQFICASRAQVSGAEPGSFDYVMLIDVLEHLNQPLQALDDVTTMLKPRGSLLISVPTHRYPQVFGRDYHEAVGHVRDGFNLHELDELLGSSYERVQHSYNTGPIASAACTCFYRFVPKIRSRKLAIVSMIFLHLSRLFDVFNSESRSASLWAVYRLKP